MIIAVIILFVSFNIFFPGFSYKSKWDEALILVKSRDIILSMDRLGLIYDFSFNTSLLQNFLYSNGIIERSLISWSNSEGTIKDKVKIACNCSPEFIADLVSWIKNLDLKINGRKIEFEILYSNLEEVNPSDVLLIWGYKNLSSPVYLSSLRKYLSEGSGIVEIANLNETLLDETQKQIFGLKWLATWEWKEGDSSSNLIEYIKFRRKPNNSSDIIYGTYKYFFHIPFPVFAPNLTSSIPGFFPTCTEIHQGSFLIRLNSEQLANEEIITSPESYSFWICDSSSVYFDTDDDGVADVSLTTTWPENLFGLKYNGMILNFSISYIKRDRIGIKFLENKTYYFSDFSQFVMAGECPYKDEDYCSSPGAAVGNCRKCFPCPRTWDTQPCLPPPYDPEECEHLCSVGWTSKNKTYNLIYPIDEDKERILLEGDKEIDVGGTYYPVPAVILNGTKVAWSSDFFTAGLGDDEKLLLISLLFWASNKKTKEIHQTLRTVYLTPYLNVKNEDLYEVYKFSLGLGSPY